MRILLSAFSISPTRGSEPGVGWQFATRLAEHHQVTVLYGDLRAYLPTHGEIEEWVKQHPEYKNLKFVYVRPGRLSTLCEKLHNAPGLQLLYYTGYRLWQLRALKVARELVREQPFDLVHQLTYATYREPGYLWKLDLPFFWGPMSGGNVIPLAYAPILGLKGSLQAIARVVINKLTFVTRPRVVSAARKASHLWCVTPREQEILRSVGGKTSLMLETGSATGMAQLRSRAEGEMLHLVWSGLHMPRKALPLLIRAIARLSPESRLTVHILGKAPIGGSDTGRAQALADKLGVSSKLAWHGHLPHQDALALMAECHALIHTSLLEATGCVVMEAIDAGMPVICHDACGMATAVTDKCGIKIPLRSVEESIGGFAVAIERFLVEPELVERLSEGAIERARQLSWEEKIQEVNEAYSNAVEA